MNKTKEERARLAAELEEGSRRGSGDQDSSAHDNRDASGTFPGGGDEGLAAGDSRPPRFAGGPSRRGTPGGEFEPRGVGSGREDRSPPDRGSGHCGDAEGAGSPPHLDVGAGSDDESQSTVARSTSGSTSGGDGASLDCGRGGGVLSEYGAVGLRKGEGAQQGEKGQEAKYAYADAASTTSTSVALASPPLKSPLEQMGTPGGNKANVMDIANAAQEQRGYENKSRHAALSANARLPPVGTGFVTTDFSFDSMTLVSTTLKLATSAEAPRPEIIGGDYESSLPTGMIRDVSDVGREAGWQPGGVAEPSPTLGVEIDADDAGPPPLPSMTEPPLEDVGTPTKSLNSSKNVAREPRNEELENTTVLVNLRGPADIAHRINNNRHQSGIDGIVQGPPEDHADAPENNNSTPDPDRHSIQVPVAWAVSESNANDTDEERQEVVIIAAPLEPSIVWWKQRNARRFFSLVCVLLIAGAIAIGVLSPSGKISQSTPPSIELTPSPSSSPTECARQISSSVQTIDLQVGNLSETPEVAVDGQNMVAVVQDSSTSITYTKFYLLRNDEWIVTNTFIERHHLVDSIIAVLLGVPPLSVGLSGKTAFVGSGGFAANVEGGVASVYEQNQFGDWERVDDPFVHDTDVSHGASGHSIGIDGDLACVADWGEFHLLLRDGTKWVPLPPRREVLVGEQLTEEFIVEQPFEEIAEGRVMHPVCSVSGDTIAIAYQNSELGSILQLYNYDADQGEVVPLQDPISAAVGRMDLSSNHLVFSTWFDDIFIYRREDADQAFALHQQISSSYFGRYIPFAFDKDIIVVGGEDDARIFSEQDGRWEETFALDQHGSYINYQLSGRILFAENKTGVYSFNIEGCAQAMPTSMPSEGPTPSPTMSPTLSQSPSLSVAPSMTALPSVSPSSSLSPTEACFFLEIDVFTNWFYHQTWWDVSSVATVNGTQEKKVVYDSSTIYVLMGGKTFSAAHVQDSATDASANGALCNCGAGGGRCDCQNQVCLIQRGGNAFEDKINHCEDGGGVAAIIYDNVEEPLFTPTGRGGIPAALIGRADGRYLLEHGLGKAVSVTVSSALQFKPNAPNSRRACLPAGDYEFTIYNHIGPNYEVTSNGALVAKGGRSGREESTTLSLPFIPARAPV